MEGSGMDNPEQEYYNSLKKLSTEELIERARREQIDMFNAEIRLNMINNLLINRGKDVRETYVFFEPYKFA
jgi:hypothetical protein